MVARDGIEPPTPAFSGLLTDNAKRFGINGSSWPTETYRKGYLGPFGLIWAIFGPPMFPYCSLDFGRTQRLHSCCRTERPIFACLSDARSTEQRFRRTITTHCALPNHSFGMPLSGRPLESGAPAITVRSSPGAESVGLHSLPGW